jgi:hypothetical protein
MADASTSPGWPPEPEEQLYWLLRALAVERDELYRRLGAARGEADRLRATLRRWQAEHGHCFRRGPANQGWRGGARW